MATAAQKYIAEFIGTYLLVFTVGCNVLTSKDPQASNWAVTSIACVLMVAIYALGHVSGAHFNPAVSVTCGLADKAPWSDVGVYVVVQILAGICAGLCYHAAFAGPKPFTLGPAATFSWQEVMLVEMLYTCMLCFVVLNVAATSKNQPNEYYGLAIGFVVVAGGYAAGGISGGAFNPAVAFGIDVAGAATQFGWCFYYLVYELIGAAIAAGLFRVVRPEEFGGSQEYTMSAKLVSEFIGTFYLCLTVGLCVLGKSPVTPWAAAAALMCMIYALGSVSGANYNPAVSLALVLRGKLDSKTAGLYMAVQIAGSVVAFAVCKFAQHGQTFGFGPSKGGYGWGGIAAAEIVFTFVLCFVVLGCCTVDSPLQQYFGLAIGSCVTVGGFAIGAVSGGSLNPAVSLGATLLNLTQGGKFTNGLAYASLEFLGGALAAVAFKATHTDEKDV